MCPVEVSVYLLEYLHDKSVVEAAYKYCLMQISAWELDGTYDEQEIHRLRFACQQDFMDGLIAVGMMYRTQVALCLGITVTDSLDPTGLLDLLYFDPVYDPHRAWIYDIFPWYPGNPNPKPRPQRWEPWWSWQRREGLLGLYPGLFTDDQWDEWGRGLEACAGQDVGPARFTTPTVIPRWYGD
jgi:hypothetical protein